MRYYQQTNKNTMTEQKKIAEENNIERDLKIENALFQSIISYYVKFLNLDRTQSTFVRLDRKIYYETVENALF